jgi:hypothetical protein
MMVSNMDDIWRRLYFIHWGVTQESISLAINIDGDASTSWKMQFMKRKTDVLLQQMKEGRPSYAKRKKAKYFDQFSEMDLPTTFV